MIVGIDPGVHGAIAWIDSDGGLFDVVDMPVAEGVNGAGVAHELLKYGQDRMLTVVVEQVRGYSPPGRSAGGNSMFNFGKGYGILLGVVQALGMAYPNRYELEGVPAATWKRGMGLNKDKERSRRRAIELWPASYEKFHLKKHDGRAEAALLARWWFDKYERQAMDDTERADRETAIEGGYDLLGDDDERWPNDSTDRWPI